MGISVETVETYKHQLRKLDAPYAMTEPKCTAHTRNDTFWWSRSTASSIFSFEDTIGYEETISADCSVLIMYTPVVSCTI